MISIKVRDREGEERNHVFPTDMGLSLMEALKASEYPIAATCGGMALCATCHVEVQKGFEKLEEPGDSELDMIDTLPNATECSRLACQLRISDDLDGAEFELMEEV